MGLRMWDHPGGGFVISQSAAPGGGGGTPGELVFWEDFRAAWTTPAPRETGNGLIEIANNATINRITKGSASGTWPAQLTHVAENVYIAGMNAAFQALNLWAAPATGEYLFYRMLLNNALPAQTGAGTGGDHGFQCNANAPVVWGWRIWHGDADSFSLEALAWDESGSDEFQVDAPKNVVLRLEWRLQRTGTNSFVLTARATNNQTGVLLHEHGGMTQTAAPGGGENPFQAALFGMSGQGGADYNGGSVYWGAIAVRTSSDANDWIGAYPVGPEII